MRLGLVLLCWVGLSALGFAQERGTGNGEPGSEEDPRTGDGSDGPVALASFVSTVPHSLLLDTPGFDPANPLPGKKEAVATGRRAILPTIMSLTLAASGIYVAHHTIREEAILGQRLPKGSFAVATFASVMPSVGRLFVPTKHPVRNAILYTSGRMFTFLLYSACNFGLSAGGRTFAEVGFLTFSAIDVGTTSLLRFP